MSSKGAPSNRYRTQADDNQRYDAAMANLAVGQRQAQERAERRVLAYLRARPVRGIRPEDEAINCACLCGMDIEDVAPILSGVRR